MSKSSKFSICMPVCGFQIEQLVSSLAFWCTENAQPITPITDTKSFDLVIVFNDAESPYRNRFIQQIWDTLELSRYFNKLVLHSLNLSEHEDLYEPQPRSATDSSFGFVSGPNNMFFSITGRICRDYDWTFLMETDCFPLRPNWLEKISDSAVESNNAWVLGSLYLGHVKLHESKSGHLNGNALYKTGDDEFHQFATSIWKHELSNYVTHNNSVVPYDSFWMEYFYELNALHDKNDRLQAQIKKHFQPSPFVINLGAVEDRTNLETTFDEVSTMFPDAVIVHGEWFRSEADRIPTSKRTAQMDALLHEFQNSTQQPKHNATRRAPFWFRRSTSSRQSSLIGGNLYQANAQRNWHMWRFQFSEDISPFDIKVTTSSETTCEAILINYPDPHTRGMSRLSYLAFKVIERGYQACNRPPFFAAGLFGSLWGRKRIYSKSQMHTHEFSSGTLGNRNFNELYITCHPSNNPKTKISIEIKSNPTSGIDSTEYSNEQAIYYSSNRAV